MNTGILVKRARYARSIVQAGVALTALTMVLLAGCELGFTDPGGDLSVEVSSLQTMTLLPDVDVAIDSYRLEGSGPNGETFTETIGGTSTLIESLTPGTWTVRVIGVNAAGTDIAAGSGQTEVVAGQTASLAVTVRPFEGNGTLSLTVSWPDSEVTDPAVDASLTDSDGISQSLAFTLDGAGQASFSDSAVPAGYYTVSVRVLDGGVEVAGAVEAARIAEGATTSGTFAFTDINPPSGDVDIIVDPDLDEPLEVTLTGTGTSIVRGTDMTVTASVSNAGGEPVSFTWYINGSSIATGESATFGSSLDPGSYRLDVVAFTDDGSRSGSATHTFTVTE